MDDSYVLIKTLYDNDRSSINLCKRVSDSELVILKKFKDVCQSLLLKLKHANIICPLGFHHFPDNNLTLVLPYYSSGDLLDFLPKLSTCSRMRCFTQMFYAIKYLHSKNVIHFDLKPDNVLVDGDRFLLADFDLAEEIDPNVLRVYLRGTPKYTSPECLDAIPNNGFCIDAWLLGVFLYMLMYNVEPFESTVATRHHKPKITPGISSHIVKIIDLLLVKDHLKRGTLDMIENLIYDTTI